MKLNGLFIALIVVVLTSCSKKETVVIPAEIVANYENCSITSMGRTATDSTVAKYDVLNRLTSLIYYESGVNKSEALYSYNTNVVVEKLSEQSFNTNITYYFKPSGQFNQGLGSITYLSSGTYNYNAQFTYNQDSLLYQVDETLTKGAQVYPFRTRYFYKDGNIIRKVNYANNDSAVTTYTYNTKENAFASLEKQNYFNDSYSIASKNLVTQMVYVDKNGTTTTAFTYTYNEDAKVKTRTRSNKNETYTETLTYQCN